MPAACHGFDKSVQLINYKIIKNNSPETSADFDTEDAYCNTSNNRCTQPMNAMQLPDEGFLLPSSSQFFSTDGLPCLLLEGDSNRCTITPYATLFPSAQVLHLAFYSR
jgi:hypothetical protein